MSPSDNKPNKGRMWAARVVLFVFFVLLILAVAAVLLGDSSQAFPLTVIGALIVVPVLLWLILWSTSALRERSGQTKEENERSAGAEEESSGEIDTVIFDIGNVLTDFSYEAWLEKSGYDKETLTRITNATILHPVWNEIDRGVLSQEELLNAFVQNDPEDEEAIRTLFSASFHGIVSKRDSAIPWIRAIRDAGYKVYYLSNFSARAETECADALDFIPLTDGGILSHKEQLTKPDPAIYKLLCERYSIEPTRAVFVDDVKANIEGAAACGLHTVHFRTQEQAEEALHALGVTYD